MTLHQALRPVRQRMRLLRLMRFVLSGFVLGCAAALIFLILTLFLLDLEVRWPFVLLIPPAMSACAGLVSLFLPVADRKAAAAADRAGLMERCQTCLETGTDTPMGQLLHEDTLQQLSAFSPKSIPVQFSRRQLLAALTLPVLCSVLLLLPNPGISRAREKQAWHEKTQTLAQEVQERADALAREHPEETEVRRILEQLSRDIAASRNPEEAYLSLDMAEKSLGLNTDSASASLLSEKELAGGLSSAGGEKAETSDSAEENSAVQNVPEKAPQTENTGSSTSSPSVQLSAQLLSAMRASLNSSSSPSAQTSVSSASSQSSASSGQTQGDGPRGNGSGLGNGEGAGLSGHGQGSGAYSALQEGHYREDAFESIYDPEMAARMAYDTSVSGEKMNDDSIQIETGPSQGTVDGTVPVAKAQGSYADTAVSAARTLDLTSAQQELVAQYFRILTDRQ